MEIDRPFQAITTASEVCQSSLINLCKKALEFHLDTIGLGRNASDRNNRGIIGYTGEITYEECHFISKYLPGVLLEAKDAHERLTDEHCEIENEDTEYYNSNGYAQVVVKSEDLLNDGDDITSATQMMINISKTKVENNERPETFLESYTIQEAREELKQLVSKNEYMHTNITDLSQVPLIHLDKEG
jgi:hypothetical protein